MEFTWGGVGGRERDARRAHATAAKETYSLEVRIEKDFTILCFEQFDMGNTAQDILVQKSGTNYRKRERVQRFKETRRLHTACCTSYVLQHVFSAVLTCAIVVLSSVFTSLPSNKIDIILV